MREVADGVLEIPLGYVNAHLVVVDDGVVLVDTGPARRTGAFAQTLKGAGRMVGDVHTILLTHWHPDHVGGLAELRARSDSRVVAHAAEAATISGDGLEPTKRVKAARLVMGPVGSTPVDERLTVDGPISVPGFSAVHTPGHTAGHVSYLLDRDGGVLFVGDAAGSRRGRVHILPRIYTEDRELAAASVRRLAGLRFDVAVFGHGAAVSEGAVDSFRELAVS